MCIRLMISAIGGIVKRLYKIFVLPIVFMFGLAVTLGSILEVDRECVARYAFLRSGIVASAHMLILCTTLLWKAHGWMPGLRKVVFAAQLSAVAMQVALMMKWETGAVAAIGWMLFFSISEQWADRMAVFLAQQVRAAKSGQSIGSLLYDVIEGPRLEEQKVQSPGKKSMAEQLPEQRYESKIIAIEGPICGGKTHLARSILRVDTGKPVILNNADRAYRSGRVVDVLPEQLAEVLHKKFVRNPAVYELPFQMVMAERRYAALHSAVRHVDKTKRVVVLDRSLAGDFSFAAWNFIIGAFEGDQFDTYLGEIPGGTPATWFRHACESSGVSMPLPVQVVFLVTPTAQCIERLKRRGGVDQGTAERYMRGIVVMHALVALHLIESCEHTKVHFYDSTEELRHNLELDLFMSFFEGSTPSAPIKAGGKAKKSLSTKEEGELLIDPTGIGGAAALRFRRILGMLFSDQKADAILDAILLKPDHRDVYDYAVSETRLFQLLREKHDHWIEC